MTNRAGRNLRRTLRAIGLAGLSLACSVSPAGNGSDGGDAGSNHDAGNGSDAGNGGDAGLDFLGMPQVVDLDPNAVLTTPKIMPIMWTSDPNGADFGEFLTDFAQSTAWATQTTEYGIGPLTLLTPVEPSTMQSSYMDGDLENMLTTNLSGASPAWGAPDPSTIYLFLMPAGVYVDDYGDESCTDFDGYHSDMQVNGVTLSYAVVSACALGFDGPGIDNLQQITIAASHEIVEASTDPFPDYDPGYVQTDDPHAVWTYVTGGEIADLCEFADTFAWIPPDMTHTIQRVYSNAAASAGTDPCVGDPTVPYYQAIPSQPDQITIDYYGYPWTTQGFTIAQGATGTITLKLVSDTPGSGPYQVSVQDFNVWYGSGSAFLDITTPTTQLNVGDTIQATVKVLGQDPNLGNGEAFVVNTSPVSGNGPTTYYFGLIGQP